jgi:hypothetical protein
MVEVVALVLALVLVPLTGGSFKRLARLEFEAPWLLFVGLGIQLAVQLTAVIPESRADDLGFALLLVSYALILSFGVLNLRITGMTVVTIGIALNVLVIALNQGMPYRAPEGAKLETTAKHRPERSDDLLTILDDRIIVPGPLEESVSFGDLILAVGILDVTYRASRRVRRTAAHVRSGHGDLETQTSPVVPPLANGRSSTHIDLVGATTTTVSPERTKTGART